MLEGKIKMQNPLVSVIMPSYNYGTFLKDSISSVLQQVYPSWELIIADNCSTDSSAEIIKKYADSDSRIKYIRSEYNSGSPAYPRNLAIKSSKGKYLCFLDADDLWFNDKLKKQVEYLEANSDIFMLYGRYLVLKGGKIIPNKVYPETGKMKSGRVFNDLFLSENFIPCITVMYRNSGNYLFDEDPRSMEDFDLWLKISKNEKIAYLDEPLAIYRVHGASTTASIKLSLSKYLVLLEKWKREVPSGMMFARYVLLMFQASVMALRKIKSKILAGFSRNA